MRISETRSARLCAIGVAVAWMMMLPASARAETEHLPDDAPESWAMFFYTSASTFQSYGGPRVREPWSVEAFLDVSSLPQLSDSEKQVGFGGTKVEDLNKSPVFGRLGVTVGFPGRLSLSVGYNPPIQLFGVRAHLLAVALERPLFERGPFVLGARLHGEIGRARGAFTCPSRVLKSEPGSDGNPYGCEKESNDTAIQRYVGLELGGSYRIDRLYGVAPYLSLGTNYLDTEFHVHARTFGSEDRTRQASHTWTFTLGAGASIPIGDDIRFAVGVFYTPLWVTRPPDTDEENDSLVQARGEISYRLR